MLQPSTVQYTHTHTLSQSVLNKHCTTPISTLNQQNTAVVFIHDISSKTFTTYVWKKFPLLYVSLQTMQKLQHFLFFLLWHRAASGGEKRLTKHLETPPLQQLSVVTQTNTWTCIYTQCGFFIGASQWSSATCTERQSMHANALTQSIWGIHGKGQERYQHYRFITHEAYHRKRSWTVTVHTYCLMLRQNVHHTHWLCCLRNMLTRLTFFLQSPFGQKGNEN